jgi:hypothetical protein
MRPITVTVGPLATASANNICASQTPSTQFALNGALAAASATFTASIAGNTLVVTAVANGVIQIGQTISGIGVPSGAVVIGPPSGPGQTAVAGGPGTYILSASGTVSSTTLYANAVATLDAPRRILFTTSANESAKTVTVSGTDYSGTAISEVVSLTNASTSYTNLDFKTVTAIYISAAAAGAITVGTNSIASSPWVRLDDYALPQVAIQCTPTGTVSYTVQQTLQDPSSAVNPVSPYQVTWLNTADNGAVNATAPVQTSYQYAPAFVKVTLNSGTGSVSAIITQLGVAPY